MRKSSRSNHTGARLFCEKLPSAHSKNLKCSQRFCWYINFFKIIPAQTYNKYPQSLKNSNQSVKICDNTRLNKLGLLSFFLPSTKASFETKLSLNLATRGKYGSSKGMRSVVSIVLLPPVRRSTHMYMFRCCEL